VFIPILSPILTQLNARWSQLNFFLQIFYPTTTSMIGTIMAVAVKLINSQHLKKWFTHCCYCTLLQGESL
jgi:hypothetical protein